MSMPAIFFTSSEGTARTVRLNHNLPLLDYAELGGLDILMMSTLWAIIDRKEYDDALFDEFESIYESDGEWTYKFPDDLVQKLAQLTGDELNRVSREWAATEEMSCKASEALQALTAIKPVAERALSTNRALFLYTCL